MYVSIPFYDADRIVAVVRTSVPIASIEHVLQKARTGIAACAVVLALLATVASLVITHRINRPMEEMHRRFVADVSHELRTPITSIKGFIETLLDGAMKNPADTERFLRIAARQSDRLYAIVEDLLTLSRLEQEKGDIQVVLEEVPLRQVLQNSIQVCESKAGDRNIDVHLTCGEHIIVRVNAALIEQAFVNLVDNAIKFSPAESTIWVEAREEKKDAVIHVRDEGSGIESKHIPRLFERFYRVDKARSRSLAGTGLGLAIVKHIVVLHRGRIHVESKPGKGSTFSVYLPRKSAQCRQS
jgi:two-component system phosphate regulon sensor histidine kinase PhoR